jgi:hypothetical protein
MYEPLESNRKDENPGLPWDSCYLCGELDERGLVPYKSGVTAPIVGEVLTGGTSHRTGIVSQVVLQSGAWSGTAAGTIQVVSPTGWDIIEQILFTNGETVTGDSGAHFVADGDSTIHRSGRQYSRAQIVDYNGQRFCIPHFHWRYNHRFIDETKVDLPEEIRNVWY